MDLERMKTRIQMLLVFYKSTLTLSICFSLVFAVIGGPAPFRNFGIALMTGGTVIGLLYKEISHKNEYYFYYNTGISKLALLFSCAAINTMFGLVLCLVQSYV